MSSSKFFTIPFLSSPDETVGLNNINVKYLNSDAPPKFIATPLTNINPSEVQKTLKKISKTSETFSEHDIQEILKPSFDKKSNCASDRSSIDQVTPIPSPRLSQKNKKSDASRFSTNNEGNTYDIKRGTCFSSLEPESSKPSNSSIPGTPETPKKLHLQQKIYIFSQILIIFALFIFSIIYAVFCI